MIYCNGEALQCVTVASGEDGLQCGACGLSQLVLTERCCLGADIRVQQLLYDWLKPPISAGITINSSSLFFLQP